MDNNFKYNKTTGKFDAPQFLNEEYIETIDGDNVITDLLEKIEEQWHRWQSGPATERSDIKPAKKELIRYITKYFEKNL